MKLGDLIRLKSKYADIWNTLDESSFNRVYIVKRTETKNNWVFVFGSEGPIQMSLMEVIGSHNNSEVNVV